MLAFSDDGKLGSEYNAHGTLVKGMFLGGRFVMHPSLNTTLTLLGENDGWDWNAGVVGYWRGISLGVYGTELEEGSKSATKGTLFRVYNYTKWNVSLGYNGNIYDIGRNVFLRTRVTELQREQDRLRGEITTRERRIASLEGQLRQAQAGELADIAKRRDAMNSQIQEERDAIKRAEDRLKQLQSGQQNPPANPPANPPSNPPLH